MDNLTQDALFVLILVGAVVPAVLLGADWCQRRTARRRAQCKVRSSGPPMAPRSYSRG